MLTEELKLEGKMRELVRQIQEARKEAGLEVDDRIKLSIFGAHAIIEKFEQEIKRETLAVEIIQTKAQLKGVFQKEIKIEGQKVQIWISKNIK